MHYFGAFFLAATPVADFACAGFDWVVTAGPIQRLKGLVMVTNCDTGFIG
jgi:hypothetical protein